MRKKKKYNPNSPESVFKRLYGVKPYTFEKMMAILQKEYDELHKKGILRKGDNFWYGTTQTFGQTNRFISTGYEPEYNRLVRHL